MSSTPETVDLKFGSVPGATIVVQFEPLGTLFEVSDGDYVVLRAPLHAVGSIEVLGFPSGISVWVLHGEEYIILDRNGAELDRL
ncbi:hypothetical protein [Nocardia sp. CA-135398]|uniref:hypothetical protein n=1 Tax=Nocardia sp. CA-135398 TaxID=3239977 RepID=UPI003D95FE99